ncbi:MAG: hypothetical protein COU27_02035 [Candidatus Levybacteria bacterium CG10_big_fil_rev_8_21_14_0_10_36_7]|nr:MAG: hypothetical protein COU27_02035 [Candidatus Levybacteria bacterium CG10_big_fil_rev_8_21_14_0_10_36_7]
MFGLLLGIYSYGIFFLGILGILQKDILLTGSIVFWSVAAFVFSNYISIHTFLFVRDFKTGLVITFIFLSIGINLIGALGPELSYDSLWYHLTLPKLYLQKNEIFFIPGGLLYYSAMPKLAELLYIPAVSFTNEIGAKFIHFGFGIGGIIVLYQLTRRFLSQKMSLLVIAVLVSNLVFAWEVITAYSDLMWLFYEVLAFATFFAYLQSRLKLYLILTGVFLGFAITTKLVAIISIPLYSLLFLYYLFPRFKNWIASCVTLLISALVVPLPWFIFSYINTRNPVYPFFSGYLSSYEKIDSLLDILRPGNVIENVSGLFLFSPDPVSPIYLIFFPLVFLIWKFLSTHERLIFLYCLLVTIFLYLIPESGGARFLLPYLPVFSLGVGIVIFKLTKDAGYKAFGAVSVAIILLVLFSTIIYRAAANTKYIPYLLGQETKSEFLTKHLEFGFSDFYDSDGYFAENIQADDMVLLFGFHNLYYVNFPFVHESWYTGEPVTHVATQRTELPDQYLNWGLVYENEKTRVKVYEKP